MLYVSEEFGNGCYSTFYGLTLRPRARSMRPFFLVLLLLLSPLALAQPPADGYLARVAVPDQSEGARAAALGPALGLVLERAGGQPAGHPKLLNVLTRAPKMLQRFSYERDPATGQLMLVAGFDPRAVDAALTAAGLPVWGQMKLPTEDVALSIGSLQGIGDYGRALAALRTLPGVRGIAVLGAEDSRLLLRARVEGGAGALAAATSPLLQREADAGGALRYNLIAPAAAVPQPAPAPAPAQPTATQ